MTERSDAETREDFGLGPEGTVSYYKAIIAAYDKTFKTYTESARKIVKRYRDEDRDEDDAGDDRQEARRLSTLWSMVNTWQPVLFAKLPKPYAERRHGDRDPVARLSAMIVERALSTVLDADDPTEDLKHARDDYLLCGRGQVWVRSDPVMAEDGSVAEWRFPIDFVHWEDFGHSPVPTWPKVAVVWRRVLMTREALVKRFGEEIGNKVPLDHTADIATKEDAESHPEVFKRATVYELWDRDTRKAFWIAKGYNEAPLDEKEDPLKLRGFFPCPRPLYATITTNSLVPVPDYTLYKSQAQELDDLTMRIGLLLDALRVVGVYNGKLGELDALLTRTKENTMIPVDNWAMFAEKGGLKGQIDFLPIEPIVATLNVLVQQRVVLQSDLDRVTGIADIVRGQTSPNETLGAQKIKGQYASLRLQDRQTAVARFIRDALELKAELLVEHVPEDSLLAMANAQEIATQADGSPAPIGEAVALLKNEKLRGTRVDFETDQIIQSDQQAMQKSRMEFLTSVSGFLKQAVEAGAQFPDIVPLLGRLVLFGVRSFPVGRELENAFETFLDRAQKAAEQPKPPQPSPEEIKAKADMDMAQMQAQADIAKIQAKAQSDMQLEQMRAQIKTQAELDKAQIVGRIQAEAEVAKETARAQAEGARESARVEIERIKAQAEVEAQRFTQELEARKLALAEEEARHRVKLDSAKLVLDAAKAGIDPTNAVAPDVQAQAMQALSETMAPLASLADLPNALKSMAAGMAELARSQGAEKEVIRDPMGRAVGMRTKVSGVVIQ